MSIRLSTRYTVVPRAAASLSIGVSGRTNRDTSAMSTRGQRLSRDMYRDVLTDACFNVAVGQRPCMKGIINVLATYTTKSECGRPGFSNDSPGGSILQIMRSRKSSLSLHSGCVSDFGGTTQLSPSGGKQSRMAFPKGRYGTSNSRSRLSCSASLLSTLPSARTK